MDEWQKRRERSDTIWTVLIVLSYIAFWPVGIVLTVLKCRGRLPLLGFDAEALKQSAQRAASSPPRAQQSAKPARTDGDVLRRMRRSGTALLTAGAILAAIGLLAMVGARPDSAAFVDLWSAFAPGSTFAVGGAAMAFFGAWRRRRAGRAMQYAAMIDRNRPWASIHELAYQTHRKYKKVCQDLQAMLEHGFWPGAWIDSAQGRLMFTPYEAQTAPRPDTMSQAERVLRQIRADNDLIADAEVSRKIERIELLTGKIFDYLDHHPQTAPQLAGFLDYYLPQTMKLLESYARLETVQTGQARQGREKISAALDKLADGYEKQLDKLFQSDVLDITAEIEVMEQMLKKDGLGAEDFAFEKRKKPER